MTAQQPRNPTDWPAAAVRDLILRRSTALAALSPETIAAIVAAGRVVTLPGGSQIATREKRRNEVAIILSGTLRTYSISPDGREYRISIQEAGDVHGVLSCLDGAESPHDAVADTELCVLQIRETDLRRLMERHADLREALLQILCTRLRQSFAMLDNFAIGSPRLRLANRLVELASTHGRKVPAGILLDLPLTQDSLGAMIGLSRQRTNLHLKAFEREGLLVTDGGRIVIRKLELLVAQE
ncbi:Crp/Fnr family transcriptional regulator [Acidimangrovimonas pyrenivorans]|uniref:Crp/Fnr family transcriptional regulator n=1 Tax=Acidimangrovimonas pyrenivorans TaxID=2030798 RepID=A0ABV7AF18_9RHOB